MSLLILAPPIQWESVVDPTLRWLHILSGILWIGLLYFFNFVNVPLQGRLDDAARKAVNPELLPRALWWFRWAAMMTLLFGLALFLWKYVYQANFFAADSRKPSDRAMWIMWGMVLGIKMWANVWFVIWPAQRTILRALAAGEAAPAKLAAKAKRFSRLNTYLSGPMLFAMIIPDHYSLMQWPVFVLSLVVGLLVPLVLIRLSEGVGRSV